MSLARDNFYSALEPLIGAKMSRQDAADLDTQEDDWLQQAQSMMTPDQFSAAQAQWTQWRSNSAPYRLAAYYDSFGGVSEDIPEVLKSAVGWQVTDDNPVMNSLFALVTSSIAELNGTGTGSTSPAGAGIGIGALALIGLGLWFMFGKKR